MLNKLAQTLPHYIVHHYRQFWVGIILVIGIMAAGIPHFGIDASSDSILLEGDKSLQFYQEIIRRYEFGVILAVVYQAKDKNVFSEQSRTSIDQLTQELAALDRVSSVISITNTPLLFSPKVDVQALLNKPNTILSEGVDMELAANEFKTNPLYSDTIVSEDNAATAIILNLVINQQYLDQALQHDQLLEIKKQTGLTKQEKAQMRELNRKIKQTNKDIQNSSREFINEIHRLGERQSQHGDIVLGGATMLTIDMIDLIKEDMTLLGFLILLVIIVMLLLLFQQWQLVVLPLATCLSVILIMVGLLGWLRWDVSLISSNFVIFLLTISLAICIHLQMRFRELYQLGSDLSLQQAVAEMMRRMWRPCLYNMITTVLAFASLVVSGIRPVIDFGWMMVIGVMVSLAICYIMIPIGLLLFSKLPQKKLSSKHGKGLRNTAIFALNNGKWVYLCTFIIVIIALTGITKLDVENRFIDFFKDDTQTAKSMTLVDRDFGGTMPLDIILSKPIVTAGDDVGGSETTLSDKAIDDAADDLDDDLFSDDWAEDAEFSGDDSAITYWWSKAGMDQIEQLHDFLEAQPEIGKVYSLATGYKLGKSLLDIELGDVELALLRKELGDLEEQLLKPYLYEAEDQTRINLRVHETFKNLNRSELMQRIRDYAENDMQLQPQQIQYTGLMYLYNNMLQSLFNSQILTLGAVFLTILLMVSLLFRSLLLAFIAIAPNIISALLILGLMGHLGISLDFMTITIAAITIGIGIDYAIHYLYRFRYEMTISNDCAESVRTSHDTIGRSLVFSALTIISGFSILLFSNFIPLTYFAILTSLAMFIAMVGVLTLVPKLLIDTVAHRK